jgi:hypothetical protein
MKHIKKGSDQATESMILITYRTRSINHTPAFCSVGKNLPQPRHDTFKKQGLDDPKH